MKVASFIKVHGDGEYFMIAVFFAKVLISDKVPEVLLTVAFVT